MFRWIPYAFVRIVFFFIVGILLGIYFPEVVPFNYALIILVLLTTIYITIAIRLRSKWAFKDPTSVKLIVGFVGLCTTFIAGYLTLLSNTGSTNPRHLIYVKQPISFYKATLISDRRESNKSWKIEAEVSVINVSGVWKKCTGKVLLYFFKNDSIPYHYGHVLVIKGTPRIISPPSNPGEFNYKQFLSYRNIYHQHFIRKNEVKFVENSPPSLLMEYTIASRNWAEAMLNKYVKGNREHAIVSALVLGVTDGLDNELLNAYAATGTIHVLAVSGLHVGIIYWILLLIFKPLNRTKSGKWILALISILILWSYAFVTGLSPSVLRAVTMFSFVALSRPNGSNTNIYNTLALSAFILLLYDPYLIMSVGFQLSYLAVLGIVYFHPMIHRIWEPDTKVLSFIWETTSISIAAQLATFPLVIFYFHQFPNYFVVSNLFVIPISSLVLIAGLVLLMVSFISVMAIYVGYFIVIVVKVMNFIVFSVESLPFSLVENIYINAVQCWLLVLIIISLIFLFRNRKFSYFIATTCLVTLYAGMQWFNFYNNINPQKIAIYNIKGHQAIDLIDSGNAYFVTDSILRNDNSKIQFHIKPLRVISNVNTISDGANVVRSFSGCSVISWKGIHAISINEKGFTSPLIKADYLIISNNSIQHLKAIQHIKFKKLIIDSSNSWHVAQNIKAQADAQGFDFHSVLHNGAYIVNL